MSQAPDGVSGAPVRSPLDADLSEMSLAELMASAAAHHQELERSQARLRRLLEENQEAIAQYPELQEELERLQALAPNEVSGPGS